MPNQTQNISKLLSEIAQGNRNLQSIKYLPLALLLDFSYSMRNERELLNNCVVQFLEQAKSDPLLYANAMVLVIIFNHRYEVKADFVPLRSLDPAALEVKQCAGATDPGQALLYALERMDEKKQELKDKQEEYFQPMMVYFTDGYPDAGVNATKEQQTQVERTYQLAAEQIRDKEKHKKLLFIAAGLQRRTGGADIKKIQELTIYPDKVLRITKPSEAQFKSLADILLDSTQKLAAGTPVDKIMDQCVGGTPMEHIMESMLDPL